MANATSIETNLMCIRCIQNDVIIIFVVIDIRPSVIVPSFGMLWDVWDALGCFFGRSTIPKSVSIRNGILEMGLFFFFFFLPLKRLCGGSFAGLVGKSVEFHHSSTIETEKHLPNIDRLLPIS